MERKGLGKGLGALFSDALSSDDASTVRLLTVDRIRANPYQPRTVFDTEKLNELVLSIKEHGILQPLIVRRVGLETYELVAGERRLRAAQLAGLTAVPAIVREYADGQMLEIALIENVQREDINPVESARAYSRLMDEFGMTQEDVARRVGKARSTIANTVRLLQLPEPVLASVVSGEISEAHARAILQAAPEAQVDAWKEVVAKKLSVRATEELGRRLRTGAVRPKESATVEMAPIATVVRDPNEQAVEDALQTALGTKVTIRRNGHGGKVEIEFYSEEELEGIVDRILREDGR